MKSQRYLGQYKNPTPNTQYPIPNTQYPIPHTINPKLKINYGVNYEQNSNISGFERLEGSDESGRDDLQRDNELSEGGNLRHNQPNKEGCSFDTGEYSRGIRQKSPEGILKSSINSEGLTSGIRNASFNSDSDKLHNERNTSTYMEAVSNSGKANISTSKITPTLQTLSPKPKTLDPKSIEKIKILDPACGSGSFLVGAYKFLLNYHLDYYTNPANIKKAIKEGRIYDAGVRVLGIGDRVQDFGDRDLGLENRNSEKSDNSNPNTPNPKPQTLYPIPYTPNPNPKPNTPNPKPNTQNDYRLTIREKRNILLNNIYGVDIDRQAVEVTKLSLLLTLMEGEIVESRSELFLKSISEALLPNLDNNIKCGNSLIGSDFYNDKDMELFDKHELRKINCFDWEEEFPQVFGVRDSGLGVRDSDSNTPPPIPYTQNPKPYNGGFDCVIGNPPYGAEFSVLEKKYLKYKYIAGDIEVESYLTFIEKSFKLLKNTGRTGLIIPNNILTNIRYYKIRELLLNKYKIHNIIDLGSSVFKDASVDTCIIIGENRTNGRTAVYTYIGNIQSLDKINYNVFRQNDFRKNQYSLFNIYISKEDKNLIEKIKLNKIDLGKIVEIHRGIEFGYDSEIVSTIKNENNKPIIAGRCFSRYRLKFDNKYVNFNENDISNFKSKRIYETEKIFVRRIGKVIQAYLDREKYYNVCDVYNLLLHAHNNISLSFLLGILNSKLMSYYLVIEFKNAKKLFPKIPISSLQKLPIVYFNFENKKEKEQHDRMVSLVEQMLEAQKEAHSEKNITDTDKKIINQRIKILDKQIDAIVYELYGLTEEEIKIVESV